MSIKIKDIKEYLINEVNQVKEFEVIKIIENEKLNNIKNIVNDLISDQFIDTSTKKGVIRREEILNIQPYADDTIESRKYRILAKWNNELPYTYRKLLAQLNDLIGDKGYYINLNHNAYKLDIIVNVGELRFLQSIHRVIKDMVPANIIIIFAGRHVSLILVDISYENTLTLQSDFYPRHNIEYMNLDGTWLLDGLYLLNGTKTSIFIDLYPLELLIKNFYNVKTDINSVITNTNTEFLLSIGYKSKELNLISDVNIKNKIINDLKLNSHTKVDINSYTELKNQGYLNTNIETNNCFIDNSFIDVSKEYFNKLTLFSSITKDKYIENKLINIGNIDIKKEINSNNNFKSELKKYISNKNELSSITSDTIVNKGLNSNIIIERHLWYLDGKYNLDGSKQLDPAIIIEEL